MAKGAEKLDADYKPYTKNVVDVARRRLMDLSPNLIFHYCSAETLLAILQNGTIRFSDASCMNDGEEVIWAERQFEKAIQRLRDRDDIPENIPAIPKKFIDEFQRYWDSQASHFRHFLAAFSLSGDSLSQWRAYADDARGFAIGFCAQHIDIPARFISVEYDEKNQQSEIISFLVALYKEFKEDSGYFVGQGDYDATFIMELSSAYKNPAFVDEREVRGIHIVDLVHDEDAGPRLESSGGHAAGQSIEGSEIEYRVAKGKIIPYIDFKFQIASDYAIKEIWLGPRCATTRQDLEIFLGTLGRHTVQVKEAGSKYR